MLPPPEPHRTWMDVHIAKTLQGLWPGIQMAMGTLAKVLEHGAVTTVSFVTIAAGHVDVGSMNGTVMAPVMRQTNVPLVLRMSAGSQLQS
mmetsp:Transcript_10284/g.25738  ORF Transcript_10284/g.25738 Transcript_10284/m.25738 type:complete len:90 (+) Transcript_10284:188-457(+)